MSHNILPIISEFLGYLRDFRRYSDNTIRSYTTDLEHYQAFCMNFDPEKNIIHQDENTIKAYLNSLSVAGLGARTMARRLASIKSFYKYLLLKKYIKVNIAQAVKTPRLKKELPHYLSLKEAQHILTLPRGKDIVALRHRLILELFYSTGMRISELISLQIEDIRVEESLIHVIGKGNKERLVLIGKEAQKVLKLYIVELHNTGEKSPYLFPSLRKGKNNIHRHISNRTVFDIVKKYLKIVSNDEKLSPHSLRHTFATHMLNNGADLMVIKDLLGHSSLSSTQVYTHLQQEKLKEVYKQAHPHGK
ncbi:MAG: tyrosine recombinase XerC [Candidatus Marinimicrobia bacterium]|nr:tyrosine recombinase XerC [Candidatus Neomarinimicrobiota bacterium]MDP6852821.1 tyrosine recombinase XerC [Candidatus Neomarinimicrobiota bacterium]